MPGSSLDTESDGEAPPLITMAHLAVLLAFPGQLLIFFVPQPAQQAAVITIILLSVRRVRISFPHICGR